MVRDTVGMKTQKHGMKLNNGQKCPIELSQKVVTFWSQTTMKSRSTTPNLQGTQNKEKDDNTFSNGDLQK